MSLTFSSQTSLSVMHIQMTAAVCYLRVSCVEQKQALSCSACNTEHAQLKWDNAMQAKRPQGPALWANYGIIVVFSLGGTLAAIGSLRQIGMHARTYNLFH